MKLILMLLAMMATAQAQQLSYLGMCNPSWDCKASKAAWSGRKTIITGWLEQTFGRQCKCPNELLNSAKDKIIRIHLVNSPCVRNKRCGPQEVLRGETVGSASVKVAKKDRRIMLRFRTVVQRLKLRLANAKGSVQCYVSPCLECNLSRAARRVLFGAVRRSLPGCVPVDNPEHGACINGTVCERHGNNPNVDSPCIADLDGTNGKEVDLRAYYRKTKKCDLQFYWEPFMNCVLPSALRFMDPMERECRVKKLQTKRIGKKLCQLSSLQSLDIC